VNYNKEKLHKVGYFRELLKSNPDKSMLRSPSRSKSRSSISTG
jgi:hypothetical protein